MALETLMIQMSQSKTLRQPKSIGQAVFLFFIVLFCFILFCFRILDGFSLTFSSQWLFSPLVKWNRKMESGILWAICILKPGQTKRQVKIKSTCDFILPIRVCTCVHLRRLQSMIKLEFTRKSTQNLNPLKKREHPRNIWINKRYLSP